jgi:hypothetical protein
VGEYTQKRGRIYTKAWTNIHIIRGRIYTIRGRIYTIRGKSVVYSPRIWYDLSNGEVNICKAI